MTKIKMIFEQPLPQDHDYTVYPNEVESQITAFGSHPDLIVDTFGQYSGHKVFALTFTDPQTPDKNKKRIFISRPHAHEPAGTAAMIEMAKALLAIAPYSNPDAKWRTHLLQNFIITLVPDANPLGSHRAPVKFWDGSKIPNEQFFLWMFGESGENKGERFPRLDTWDMRKVTPPALLGIAYEQIDEHTYVEPNRDYRSTFFRSFFELDKKYAYDVWLDLHQTEFINSDHNCSIHLPTCHNELPKNLQDSHYLLGEAILQRWRDSGASPPDTPSIPYQTNITQKEFLTKVWLPISSRLVHVVTEVQNNNPKTPTPSQVYLQGVAMLETLKWMTD